MKRNLLYLFSLFIIIFSCIDKPTNQGLIAKNGMVVSAREEASKIGVEILKKGGNAFDAMMRDNPDTFKNWRPQPGGLGEVTITDKSLLSGMAPRGHTMRSSNSN